MKRFLNFRFVRRVLSFVVYAILLFSLVSESFFDGPKMTDHTMLWWIMFLILDIWFFGIEYKGESDKD